MMRTLLIAGICAGLAACGTPSAQNDEALFLAEEGDGTFEADADASTYTGPAPLTVRFTADTLNAVGRVRYEWAFDDGATSSDRSPVHTFRRPGWYAVTLDTHDAAGRTYRAHLILHAWRPKDWARLQRGQDLRIVRRSIRELQRKNAELAAATKLASAAAAGERDPAAH